MDCQADGNGGQREAVKGMNNQTEFTSSSKRARNVKNRMSLN